jgi:hypothetical protein
MKRLRLEWFWYLASYVVAAASNGKPKGGAAVAVSTPTISSRCQPNFVRLGKCIVWAIETHSEPLLVRAINAISD